MYNCSISFGEGEIFDIPFSISCRETTVLIEDDVEEFQYYAVTPYFLVVVSGLIDIFEGEYTSDREIIEWFSFTIGVDVVGWAVSLLEPIRERVFNIYDDEGFNIIYEWDAVLIIGDIFRDEGDGEFFEGDSNNTVDEWIFD